jgi:hypothetical protein
MTDVLDCEPVPSSIRSARLFVVDKLQEWRCDDLVDGVALLTSELATNAVIHTGQPFTVGIERSGDRIRVEVVDAVSDPPTPYAEGDDQGLFHGLNVVDSLAAAWGCDEMPDGKVVWFELEGAGEGTGDATGLASLRELRSPDPEPEPEPGLGTGAAGKEIEHDPSHQEAPDMARRDSVIEERDRLREERDMLLEERNGRTDDRRFYTEERRTNPVWKVLLVLLILAAAAVIAFFAFGGSADVDTEGDLEIPEVDVDVNAPDVDVDSEEAPPADAEAEASEG